MKWTLRDDKIHRFRPPGGGWRYREQATGWQAPNPMSDTFDKTVERIQNHRKANPGYRLASDLDSCRQALIEQTALHISEEHPGLAPEWLVPLDEEAQKKTGVIPAPAARPSRHSAPPVAHRGGKIQRALALMNGAQILARWLGDGSAPVPQDVAERRAEACSKCPLNIPGDWFDSVTGAVADIVREEVTAKSAMDLRVKAEGKLGTCNACGCNLRLKVWVPIAYILPRMTDQELSELDPGCWIPEEAEQ